MKPGEFIKLAAESMAGRPYPDMEAVARTATEDGASHYEVDMSIAYTRRDWVKRFVTMQGLRLQASNGMQIARELLEEVREPDTNNPNYEGEQ